MAPPPCDPFCGTATAWPQRHPADVLGCFGGELEWDKIYRHLLLFNYYNRVELVLPLVCLAVTQKRKRQSSLPLSITFYGSQESCAQHHETGRSATLLPAVALERAGPAPNLGSRIELALVTGVAGEATLRK